MKKKFGILLGIALIVIILIGILFHYQNHSTQESDHQFKIVTTFYPIYIVTRNITKGAQDVEVINMTDLNVGCLHDYTLVATDMKKIEKADVIVQNGMGLENFMDKVLSTYSDIQLIDSSKRVTNQIEENGEFNKHIWTSLSNYMLQVEEISQNLCKENPQNAEIYEANQKEYITDLRRLQERYATELAEIKGKKVIGLNEALTYLAKEVNLDIISVETNHEESSLSAEKMKELIQKMKEEKINAIFIGSEDNPKSAETLAKETGATIYKLQTGLTGKTENNSYLEMMEENLKVLKELSKN